MVATTDAGTESLDADVVLVSTGARPRVVEGAEPDGERILTWEQVYDLTELPERLVEWEGSDLGLYTKIRVRVATLDGDVTAWVYVLDAYEGGLPSARYLGIMADAAEAAGAPDDYVQDLRTRPCRSIG